MITTKETQGIPQCILCRKTKSVVLRKGIREDTERAVYKCPYCLLQYIDSPFSNTAELREFYRNDYRQKYDVTRGKVLTPEERFTKVRPLMLEASHAFQLAVPEGASVLEIGCSSGYFLDAIGDKYDRFGNEWNPDDAEYVRNTGEIPCEEGDITEVFPGMSFTSISALQVLEHQPDPIQWLRDVKDRLIGGGWLYLEVPNTKDAMLTVYGNEEYRNFWYREPHISYWTGETLAAALGIVGFEAKVSNRQRYGLYNHINWMMNRAPMDDITEAQAFFAPVSDQHPLFGPLNRQTMRLDKEYRGTLEALGCADTIIATCRRREI